MVRDTAVAEGDFIKGEALTVLVLLTDRAAMKIGLWVTEIFPGRGVLVSIIQPMRQVLPRIVHHSANLLLGVIARVDPNGISSGIKKKEKK
ncbi:MAG TPA: hypothetical protein PLO78_00065 [Candidatus Omnitrophota bacterium]|nr:hypothetical protein [Candidatus Omnitrophota bacterium]